MSRKPASRKPGYFLFFGTWYPNNRLVFGLLGLFIQLGVIWPLYAVFSGAEPFILGLPLSFAWLTLMLLLAFAGMVYLYITDNTRLDREHNERVRAQYQAESKGQNGEPS